MRKKFISPFFFILSLLSPLLFAAHAQAEGPPYLNFLLESARQKELHKDSYWHTLLHYKRGPFGIRSLVDDPDFFLSEDGKYSPRAELEATIRAFFKDDDQKTKHPVCRFIARYAWIKEKLNLNPSELLVPECAQFEELMNNIKPESASLIFPTSHMNSPASMFGHTLLTIGTAHKSKLLSYAINYSAVTMKHSALYMPLKVSLDFMTVVFPFFPTMQNCRSTAM